MNNTFKRVISLVLSLMILLPMTNQASPDFEISVWGAIAVDADTGQYTVDQMPNKDSIYEDIKVEDYYNKYVVWATEKGFISGYNNKFMPGKSITVEEAKTILNRLSKDDKS